MAALQLSIPEELHLSQPILVLGPAARTGTTLIMRLLNSSGAALVYGENARVLDLADIFARVYATFSRLEATTAREIARIKSGDVDFWPSFSPSPAIAVPGYASLFYQLMLIYLRDSRGHGFERWGVKNVLRDFGTVQTIQHLLPSAKVIMVCRGLAEVIRSQKSRRFIKSLDEVEAQCRLWRANSERGLAHRHENYLVLHQEELSRDPEPQIVRLEAFVGLTGIDRGVVGRKVNTFRGHESDGRAESGYIAPSDLSPEEAALVARYANLHIPVAA